MGDLTPHFSLHEFRCKDGSEHPINSKLLCMLEAIRCHFDKPVTITSGYRSPAYNRQIGGASNSQHLYGNAADFKVVGADLKEVYDWCDRMFPISGLGIYRSWIHIDCRSTNARWRG